MALMASDWNKVWLAAFSSSFVNLTSETTRWSSNVFLRFLRLRRRRSRPVRPVSSSSSRPSLLMSSSSKSVLSVWADESEWSESDDLSSPSSMMLSERRLRCFFLDWWGGGTEAPAREEERRRAWFVAGCSSIIPGDGGCTNWATSAARVGCLGRPSLA